MKKTDLVVSVDGDKLNTISKIRTFDNDIKSFQSRIKVLLEQMHEEIENTNEYNAVLELTEKLNAAREDLKRQLQSNQTYMNLTEELADERLALKDASQNMSDFLLGYFADTRERQIELGPMQAREVILKGRLGKPKDFQTNIFSPVDTTEGRRDLE